MARLKVYALDVDGLHEWAVAAPNQRAALDALGVHQNLFAHGQGRIATDPSAIEAALARPGEPVRKPKGSLGAFAPVAAKSTGWEAALKAAPKARAAPKPTKAQLARRARQDKARADLEALAERQDAAEKAIMAERERLDARQASLQAQFESERRRLERVLQK